MAGYTAGKMLVIYVGGLMKRRKLRNAILRRVRV